MKAFVVAAIVAAGQFSPIPGGPTPGFILAAGSCKTVSSCKEAVQLWCGGYRRADADGDGIPCENVCHSKQQVDAIRKEIGC